MEHQRGDPSPQNKTHVLRPCERCETVYDATTDVLLARFASRAVAEAHLCFPCREVQLTSEQTSQKEQTAKRLKYWRGEWLRRAIPSNFASATLDAFDTGDGDNAKRLADIRSWTDSFPVDASPKGYPSLLLVSPNNGVGKTYLACAILRSLIERFAQVGRERLPYQFWTAGGIKRRMMDAQRFGGPETISQVCQDFASMWLLVLDDMGKEKLGGAEVAATYEAYYGIINDRYNAQLPMLITSNLGLVPWQPGGLSLGEIIGQSGVSRLKEMANATQYHIEGEDRR